MVIQVLKLLVLRRTPQELRDEQVETSTCTHSIGADEKEYACGVSRKGEGVGDGDEGVM